MVNIAPRARRRASVQPLSLLGLCFIGALLSASIAPAKSQSTPATPDSVPHALLVVLTSSLRDGLDTTTSPCIDFDRYVNGGWRDRTVVPKGQHILSVFTDARQTIDTFLRRLIDSAQATVQTTPDPVLRVLGQFYANCLAADSLEAAIPGFRAKPDTAVPLSRWRASQCFQITLQTLDGAVEQAFVAAVAPPKVMEYVQHMLASIKTAARTRVQQLPWMSAETKNVVRDRLHTMALKVGSHLDTVDFSGLRFTSTNFVENWRTAQAFVFEHQLNKIGQDRRTLWGMKQTTVNATYNQGLNSVEIPVAILQRPFFDLGEEDAVNYARAGTVIGHEIHHGIVAGMRWGDTVELNRRINRLETIFDSLPPVDGVSVNGKQTSNENMADLGGLIVAYDAWMNDARANAVPLIEGFTPEQRFFLAYARSWRTKFALEKNNTGKPRFLADSHAPGFMRINGIVSSIPAFAKAFGCREGDPMALPAGRRAEIW